MPAELQWVWTCHRGADRVTTTGRVASTARTDSFLARVPASFAFRGRRPTQ